MSRSKKGKTSSPLFTRGYSTCREKVSKSLRYSRSCFNCEYFYQSVGDIEEVCQNTNVLEFDMVVSENNAYCVHWKMCKGKDDNSLFGNKTGRARLD